MKVKSFGKGNACPYSRHESDVATVYVYLTNTTDCLLSYTEYV